MKLRAFTLIELLAGVLIFSMLLSVLFSVFAAMRKSERFRNENVRLTQAATYAFEPIIRSLKASDARETFLVGSSCLTVRGFYGFDDSALPVVAIQEWTVFQPTRMKLVTIDAEPIFVSGTGQVKRWVKREYFLASSPTQPANNQLIEKTWYAQPGFEWPVPLGSPNGACSQSPVHWSASPNGERMLTSESLHVTQFTGRMIVPVVNEGSSLGITKNAGFVSLSLTVSDPKARSATPVTLQTTITPTFNYGEQSE